MVRPGWKVLALAAVAACQGEKDVDSDGDGLLDSEEAELGSDPNSVDSDEDGLQDGEEVDLGTSPIRADTDGDTLLDPDELDLGTDPTLFDTDDDTYSDGIELATGHDPLDRADRIYKGFWPYNPNKDAMPDPGWDGTPLEVGERFGRITNAVDQYGEQVDLYDFGGTDKFIVIDASATWCEACIKTASWLSGGPDDYRYDSFYTDVRLALQAGAFHWVTFMTDAGGPEDPEDVERWHEAFPHDNVAVLTDPDQHIFQALNVGVSYSGVEYTYFPSFLVLDGEMNVLVRGFAWDALDFLLNNLELPAAE